MHRFVRTGELSYWSIDTAHAVVIVDMNKKDFSLLDPAFSDGPKIVDTETFMLAWSYFEYAVATIVPSGR